DNTRRPKAIIDGQEIEGPPVMTDRSWTAHFHKANGQWTAAEAGGDSGLRKQHGLQGPIDDAFMDSFIMVRPTAQPMNENIGAWATAEMNHAMDQCRMQFRGEARVRNDSEISDADMASNNLVLWGDPQSNKLLAKLGGQLPIQWDAHG